MSFWWWRWSSVDHASVVYWCGFSEWLQVIDVIATVQSVEELTSDIEWPSTWPVWADLVVAGWLVVDRYWVFGRWSGAAQQFPAWARDRQGEAVLSLWRPAWAWRLVWCRPSVGSESRWSLNLTNTLCRCWPGLYLTRIIAIVIVCGLVV